MAAAGVIGLAGAAGSGASSAPARTGHGDTASADTASATTGLDVLPFPGTPDAPAGTNVTFPALAPGQITSITVRGSRSGLHPGHLSAQPADQGSAFYPAKPFTAGERVTVKVALRSASAGTATGAPGAKRFSYTFTIGRPASEPATATDTPADVSSAAAPAGHRHLTRSYVSAPSLHPPTITISGHDPDRSQGDIFLDAQNTGHPGAYILNPRGQLLWFDPSGHGKHRGLSVFNVRVQPYRNQSVITYWEGRVVPPGVGEGKDLILDHEYKTIHTVTAGDGYQKRGTDLHEFTLGHQGSEPTAFVTIADPQRANLTSVGGPADGEVLDWIIQEIDIPTDKVIWEWNALGHVPLTDSYEPYSPGQPYDFIHINSIQQLADGHIIISARHTWTVYSIERRTGRILWELGGKHSNFSMGPSTHFEWQHDATLHKDGLVTMFDDNASNAFGQSRGLELRISLAGHRATLVRDWVHKPDPILASSQGSVQTLSDGDVFIGWGTGKYFTEDGPGGGQLFEGEFSNHVQSYRAYRFHWTGFPQQRPAIAIRKSNQRRRDDLFVSWNGATRVYKWRVLAAASKTGPFKKARSSVHWASFQTEISIPLSAGRWFEVQALDSSGKPLKQGTSAPVRAPG